MSQSLVNILTRVTVLTVVFGGTLACQKKRSPDFVQGDGEYIYTVADYNGAKFEIKTSETLSPGIAADAERLDLKDGNGVIRSLNSVEFTSNLHC